MSNADLILRAARAACQQTGTQLHQEPGWRSRGHGPSQPWRAVLLHDTITPATWSRQQLTRLLRDGYTGLRGPIANVQLERNGDAVLIAAGRAHHAGRGAWPGITSGNAQTIGVEAANNGRPERWTQAQTRWAIAFCLAAGLTAVGHNEWATPRGRKQDPWSLDMPQIRRQIETAGKTDEEDEMTPEQDARLKAIEQAVAQLAGTVGGLSAKVASIEGWNRTERRLDGDSQRLRLAVRQIADKVGLDTEYEVPDGPVGA